MAHFSNAAWTSLNQLWEKNTRTYPDWTINGFIYKRLSATLRVNSWRDFLTNDTSIQHFFHLLDKRVCGIRAIYTKLREKIVGTRSFHSPRTGRGGDLRSRSASCMGYDVISHWHFCHCDICTMLPFVAIPDSKLHGANMGHVSPMVHAIRDVTVCLMVSSVPRFTAWAHYVTEPFVPPSLLWHVAICVAVPFLSQYHLCHDAYLRHGAICTIVSFLSWCHLWQGVICVMVPFVSRVVYVMLSFVSCCNIFHGAISVMVSFVPWQCQNWGK